MANQKYIVRRPIKNPQSQIIGYEILYHGENQMYGTEDINGRNASNEYAVADTIYNFLNQNAETALRGARHFMTFTTSLLMRKVPRLFRPEELVIQIDDSIIVHPLAMHFVQQYKRDGYGIAVNEFQFVPRYLAIMDEIDYIKLNLQTTSDVSLHNVVEIANSMGKHCIGTDVDNETLYQKAVASGLYAMEGQFVAEKLATKAHDSGYLQSNFFRLMVAVTADEPDITEIENIISMDATLTYAILRLANTARFASRNRTTSVQQAVMKLGIGQLRQWIYLLCAGNPGGGLDPYFEEFLKLSLIRANFCSELMNHTNRMPISKNDAYLLGMFSTLPYLIDAPMEEILSHIPVAEEVKDALLYRSGMCGVMYDLVICYEDAEWDRVTRLSEELGVNPDILTGLYFECMESADSLWRTMSEMAG